MFKVTVIVDDAKLPKVMWALDGLVLGSPDIIPLKLESPSAAPTEREAIIDAIRTRFSDRHDSPKGRRGAIQHLLILELEKLGYGAIISHPELKNLYQHCGGSGNVTPFNIALPLKSKKLIESADRGYFRVIVPKHPLPAVVGTTNVKED